MQNPKNNQSEQNNPPCAKYASAEDRKQPLVFCLFFTILFGYSILACTIRLMKKEIRMPFSGRTVIFGCGNILLGDDGYGPAVIMQLDAEQLLPREVTTVDAGTGIREYLFDYLLAADQRPETIIILDAVDFPGRKPGEVFEIDPLEIPTEKIHDFS